MKCEYCGVHNAGDEARCLHCGVPLGLTAPNLPRRSSPVPVPVPPPPVIPIQGRTRLLQQVPRQQPLFPPLPALNGSDTLPPPQPPSAKASRKKSPAQTAPPRTARKRVPGPLLTPPEEPPAPPPVNPSVHCNAKVANLRLRIEAAVWDLLLVAAAFGPFLGVFRWIVGYLPTGPIAALGYSAAFLLLLTWYKLIAAIGGRCTLGMRKLGLDVLCFSGQSVTSARRALRVLGGYVTCGVGFLWPLIEPEKLGIPDLISESFVTLSPPRR
ncbi:MAG: RDD family protein [Bryobacteraceae bacterium]|nr:RDD family protein [Bryobacteraceae bacterium]